jgi:hypothetical protein
MFFAPGKWMPISALNLLWLTDPHDLHDTPPPDSETKRHLLGRISFLECVHGSKCRASTGGDTLIPIVTRKQVVTSMV